MVGGCSEATGAPGRCARSSRGAVVASVMRGTAGFAPGEGTGSAGTGAYLAMTWRNAVYFSVGSPASSSGAS